jgi:hypothetical protein
MMSTARPTARSGLATGHLCACGEHSDRRVVASSYRRSHSAGRKEFFFRAGAPPAGIPRLVRHPCGSGNFSLKTLVCRAGCSPALKASGLLSFARPSRLTGGRGFACDRLLRLGEQTAQAYAIACLQQRSLKKAASPWRQKRLRMAFFWPVTIRRHADLLSSV